MKDRNNLSAFLGFLLFIFLLLAHCRRFFFLPRSPEEFNFYFSLLLFFFFLALLILSLFLLRGFPGKGGGYISRKLNSFPFFQKSLLLWKEAPGEFYRFLCRYYPDGEFLVEFRFKIMMKISLWEKKKFYPLLYFFLFFLPHFIPPFFFFWEIALTSRLFYFYYSLLLLWIPLMGNFLIFYFLEYSSWGKSVLQKYFTVSPSPLGYVFSFWDRNDPLNKNRAENWCSLLLCEQFLQGLDLFRQRYSPFLLFLRSFFFSLGWFLILSSHF